MDQRWAVVFSAAFLLIMFQGFLYSYGVVLNYVEAELGWSRTAASVPMSLIVVGGGVSGIFFGRLVDRFRPNKIIAVSAMLTAVGLATLSMVNNLQSFYLLYLFIALSSGGVSLSVMSALVSKIFPKGVGIALGVSTTGFALGALTMVPLTTELIGIMGWRQTYVVGGLSLGLIAVPLALIAFNSIQQSQLTKLREMKPELSKLHKQFSLLSITYFVCGFTVNIISAHLAVYTLSVCGSTAVASAALALSIGGSVFSVVLVGALSERVSMNKLLSLVYLTRGFSLLYLLYARDAASIILFATVFGITNLATVPLTAGLAAEIFGRASMGLIFGIITFMHHVGGGLGAFFGGFVFDTTFSYAWAFISSAILCLAASFLSLFIKHNRSSLTTVGSGSNELYQQV